MRRRILFLGFLTLAAPAHAESPLIRNFVDCKPDFFELVQKERALVGPVTIRTDDEPEYR